MVTLLTAVACIFLAVAVGEYVLYNILMLISGVLRPRTIAPEYCPPLTVLIPAHNEERHIRRKLENVLQSDYPRELLEVIVVDDGSTDRTAALVREFPNVTLLQMPERKGKIQAQKTAFARASADIVALTDVTVLAPPDALKKLAAHFEDPRVGAVSAAIAVRNRTTNYLTRMSQFLFDMQNAQKLGESSLDSAGGLYGQLSLVRRAALGDFGTDVIYEDREFGITLRSRGYRTLLEPRVEAGYHAPETLEDFSRQKQRNVGAMTQSIFRHRRLLFNPKFGWYGMLIFPEYSLFRVLRAHLLFLAFGVAFLSLLLSSGASGSLLLMKMGAATVGCYLLGTAVLAPLTRKPARFLVDLFISIPAMALVAAHLATASVRYFRGDFSSLWQRVKRDRAV